VDGWAATLAPLAAATAARPAAGSRELGTGNEHDAQAFAAEVDLELAARDPPLRP